MPERYIAPQRVRLLCRIAPRRSDIMRLAAAGHSLKLSWPAKVARIQICGLCVA